MRCDKCNEIVVAIWVDEDILVCDDCNPYNDSDGDSWMWLNDNYVYHVNWDNKVHIKNAIIIVGEK